MGRRLLFLLYLLSDIELSSSTNHCVKSVRIRSCSGPYFPATGLNTERYGVSLRIHSENWKIRTGITPDRDTFHAANVMHYDSAWSMN